MLYLKSTNKKDPTVAITELGVDAVVHLPESSRFEAFADSGDAAIVTGANNETRYCSSVMSHEIVCDSGDVVHRIGQEDME